ncbi:MAG TPA: hypothetical protein VG674_30645 [Amycolatopsis sp.]|nr:hypothetical protein [Amycolatopsis sp.]
MTEPLDEQHPAANPRRTRLVHDDPTDQDWQEVGDEVRRAAERAGRERERPETD